MDGTTDFTPLLIRIILSVWTMIETIQAERARVTGVLIQDERGIRSKKKQETYTHNSKKYFITSVKIDFQE